MKLLGKLLAVFAFSILLLEILSFSILSFIDVSKKNISLAESFTNRLNDIKHAQDPTIVTYGEYDPIVQFWPTANTEYGKSGLFYNSNGFLGNGHSDKNLNIFPEKSSDTFRILLLGGSSALGVPSGNDGNSIKNNQTIAAYLEKKLNEEDNHLLKKYKYIQVLNLAQIGGWSGNNLIRLTQYFIYLDPDMLIYYNGFNDAMTGETQGEPFINWFWISTQNYFDKVAKVDVHRKQIIRISWLPLTSTLYNKFLETKLINLNVEAERDKLMQTQKKNSPIPSLLTNLQNLLIDILCKSRKIHIKASFF